MWAIGGVRQCVCFTMSVWKLRWTSERSIWVTLPDTVIHPLVSSQLAAWVSSAHRDDVRAAVPSSCGVLIEFDTRQRMTNDPWSTVIEMLESFEREQASTGSPNILDAREIRIPVCYDELLAPDMTEVAQLLNCHPEMIIEKHTSIAYNVDTMGFMPGFGYLSGLEDSLRLRRKEIPRTRVPAGSVAIAENMTAVYPHQSAGGWHLIGRTPLQLFNPDLKDPAMLRMGDSVRFERITLKEFNHYNDTQRRGDC